MRNVNAQLKAREVNAQLKPASKKPRLDKTDSPIGPTEKLSERVKSVFNVEDPSLTIRIDQIGEDDREAISKICFELASDRLLSSQPCTEKEIKEIYLLLFDTKIKEKSIEKAHSINPVAPHPAFVFRSLAKCVENLSSYSSCRMALEAASDHMSAKPKPTQGIATLLTYSDREREGALRVLREQAKTDPSAADFLQAWEQHAETIDAHSSRLSKFPIVTASDLFGEATANKTYILSNHKGQHQWVFKPTTKTLDDLNFCNENPRMPTIEHTASLLNFHQEFPIPFTVLIEVGGWTGSAQLYIEGKTKETPHHTKILQAPLQRLIVFDLLFSNCDRHDDNLLLKKMAAGSYYYPYGIDHDGCMEGALKPLSLDYLQLLAPDSHFNKSLKSLVSDESLDRYRERMEIHEIDEQASRWLDIASAALNQAIDQEIPINKVVQHLSKEWENVLYT